jgi:hypothetical protein
MEELMAAVKESMDVIVPAVEEIRVKGVEITSVSYSERPPALIHPDGCIAPEN